MNTEFIESHGASGYIINAPVKYKIFERDSEPGFLDYSNAKSKLISDEGVCMLTKHRIDTDELIRVEIPVGNGVIRTYCEEAWCKWDKVFKMYETGLVFVALKEEDEEVLNEYSKRNLMISNYELKAVS